MACSPIPSATSGGDNSGLADPETLAVTAAGDALYANVEADAAIAHFDREPFVAPPPPDTTPPETAITGRPKPNTKHRRASFSFLSNESGSSFQCAIDAEQFLPCGSPHATGKLRRRRHIFQVRAIDASDNVDPTPATAGWKIRRHKRHHRHRHHHS